MVVLLRIASILLVAVLASCAPRIPPEEVPELYWPFPPQKPRVKFVDLIIGSLDVTGSQQGKFRRVLFGEEGEVGFAKPVFCAARSNVLYVTDLKGVMVFDFREKRFKIYGAGLIRNPTGIDVSAEGTIFVGDSARKTVFRVSASGEDIKPIVESLGNPGGLAVDDKNRRLVLTDVMNHTVKVVTFDGEEIFSFGSRGVAPGEFNFPYDVAVGPDGKIYVVDSGNFRVQVFDEEGAVLGTFGSVGTLPGQFARPKGIELDSDGNIYVVDAAFGNFQIFDPLGRVRLAVGSNGFEPGQFTLPIGIGIDWDDKIYVVDQLNRRVQIFQYLKYPDE